MHADRTDPMPPTDNDARPAGRSSRRRLPRPTIAELRATFSYDPETGEIRRKRLNRVVRMLAPDRHTTIGIDGRTYTAAAIAWALHHGEWPAANIRVLNRDFSDLRIANLQAMTHAQRTVVGRVRRDNTSGFPGVCWDAHFRKWRSYAGLDGRLLSLGCYDSFADAVASRDAAAKRLHGEFYRPRPIRKAPLGHAVPFPSVGGMDPDESRRTRAFLEERPYCDALGCEGLAVAVVNESRECLSCRAKRLFRELPSEPSEVVDEGNPSWRGKAHPNFGHNPRKRRRQVA